jgi:hypothetical protein
MRHPARPWTEADDAELRRLLDARRQPADVAHALGRTIDAIRGRAQALQISLPSRTRPWKESPNRRPRR